MLKKVKGGIAILLAIVVFLLYLPPLLCYGIINFGNATGYLLALCILIYGWLQIHGQKVKEDQDPYGSHRMKGNPVRTFNHDMGRETVLIQRGGLGRFIADDSIGYDEKGRKRVKKMIGWILIVMVVILLASVAVLMVRGTFHRTENENATVILLGCGVRGERPTRMLRQRIEATRVYLEQTPGAKAILSGGKGTGERISEAECAYRYLTDPSLASRDAKHYQDACRRQGVEAKDEVPVIEASRLYIEDQSTDTEENMEYSKRILEENRMPSDAVVLVTQDFHLYRSQCLAKAEGIASAVYGQPAKTDWWMLPTYATREYIAVWKEVILTGYFLP